MRHINFPNGRKPPQPEWLAKAKALTDRLKAAGSKAERDRIIDENSSVWTEIKEWLSTFSDGKCWFSEARETYSHYQVEHFRPKKEAREPDRDGYWWLSFDYRNYRLCGGVGNAKKGSYFPLREGTNPALCKDDNCDDEAPLLIDPTVLKDVMLITFTEGGKAEPAEPDGWQHQRAYCSIKRYKLNDYQPLVTARANVWLQCQFDVDELIVLLAKQKANYSPSREKEIELLVARLAERAKPSTPFSSVAQAFGSRNCHLWVKRCLT